MVAGCSLSGHPEVSLGKEDGSLLRGFFFSKAFFVVSEVYVFEVLGLLCFEDVEWKSVCNRYFWFLILIWCFLRSIF